MARIGDFADASKASKIIPVAGTVIDVVLTAQEIEDGGSESSALVSFLGGAGAGSGVAAVSLAASLPVGAVVLLGAAGAGLGAAGARWLWQSSVPLDVREAIDAGMSDVVSDSLVGRLVTRG